MSDERSTDYAVANLKLAIRYIGDNDRPAIRALDLATALDLVESQAADLSRLREERDALKEISGVEYCTVHDGIQIEGNSDDCDQADTNPDDECRMVALLHVAPSPDPKDGEQ